ncbi:MAG TPA: hypothetical protein PKN50_10960 [Spirochaetota bacterium]|nr:hypothetical protein [Spirochaetota bacterium]
MASKFNLELHDFVLPRYYVASQSYVNARNAWIIEIDVPGSDLTKQQCEILIGKVREFTSSGSVISIRRPCEFLAGTMLPWAVDRMDGKGVLFDDYLFD